MLRKVILTGIVALVAAVPAQANGGKELRISGPVVRASADAVAVENLIGDVVLTCLVPDRLAEKAAALKAGDKIRMVCVRHKGRKAQLVKIQRLGEHKTEPKRTEPKKTDEKQPEKQEAAGEVAELGPGAIVVQASDKRLACRVPAEKQAKLEGLKVGDKVKIYCVGGQLAGHRASGAGKPMPGRRSGSTAGSSQLSARVRDRAGRGRCRSRAHVPAALAEKIAARFAVGDSVKMMCRGSELTYLEKV